MTCGVTVWRQACRSRRPPRRAARTRPAPWPAPPPPAPPAPPARVARLGARRGSARRLAGPHRRRACRSGSGRRRGSGAVRGDPCARWRARARCVRSYAMRTLCLVRRAWRVRRDGTGDAGRVVLRKSRRRRASRCKVT